jgi:hypothetical protein
MDDTMGMQYRFKYHECHTTRQKSMACGLDPDWEWFQIPLDLQEQGEGSHYAPFTFHFTEKIGAEKFNFSNRMLITTDNERNKSAAFDRRLERGWFKFGGRVGCSEHGMSSSFENTMTGKIRLRDRPGFTTF